MSEGVSWRDEERYRRRKRMVWRRQRKGKRVMDRQRGRQNDRQRERERETEKENGVRDTEKRE